MLISRLALLASYALGCRLPSPLSASFVGSDALRTQEERHKVHQDFQSCVRKEQRASCVKTLVSQLELPPSNYQPMLQPTNTC